MHRMNLVKMHRDAMSGFQIFICNTSAKLRVSASEIRDSTHFTAHYGEGRAWCLKCPLPQVILSPSRLSQCFPEPVRTNRASPLAPTQEAVLSRASTPASCAHPTHGQGSPRTWGQRGRHSETPGPTYSLFLLPPSLRF